MGVLVMPCREPWIIQVGEERSGLPFGGEAAETLASCLPGHKPRPGLHLYSLSVLLPLVLR